MNSGRFCVPLVMAILVCAPSVSRGITLGQVDTFESGTKLGWSGTGLPILLGGPAGPNDHYVRLLGGSGSGPMFAVDNSLQWSGNYATAGVTGIEMDLINFGTHTMSMVVGICSPAFPNVNPTI